MNEPILITDMGEKITPETLSKSNVEKMSDDQIVELSRYLKLAMKQLGTPEKELKKRLDKQDNVSGITYDTSTTRGEIPENDVNKQAFFKKYGLDAFEIKSPKKLKEKFGSDIQEDLDKVEVYTPIKKINWG
ncbi:hypothetical protein JK159_09280 [Weissella minor]|uniref:hypothetical protein n=1 Tax=Weissella minor TaxID=1620 RepID=UPI001BAE5E4D|nr:hypothetical protein [Weissella minor]MBS0950538.1 hypothetical protein [Weissella minor]